MDWQVESGKRVSVFISSTSSDLTDARQLVTKVLLKLGAYPVVQEHFGPDSRTIEGIILEKVRSCDAIILLIGHAFGTNSGKIIEGNERSYTQLEFDVSVKYNKPIYLFISTDEFNNSHPLNEPESLKELQANFRNEIINDTRKYEWFSSEKELQEKIHGVVQPIIAKSYKKSMVYVHPPPRPSIFVGRDEELIQVKDALLDQSPSTIAILGMGGQGKTTLIAQSLRSMQDFPFSAGIWISTARGSFTFGHFLDKALEIFEKSNFEKMALPGMEDRVTRLIELMQKRPVLIVIDGIERWLKGWSSDTIQKSDISNDTYTRESVFDGLDTFLMEASALDNGSHLVIISRALPEILDTLLCAIVPILPNGRRDLGLQGLMPNEAVKLLKSMGVLASDEKMIEIANRLVCHPLALIGFAKIAMKLGPRWEKVILNAGLNSNQAFFQLLKETQKHLPDSNRSTILLKLASLCLDNVHLELLEWLWHWESKSHENGIKNDDWLIHRVIALSEWNLITWDPANLIISFHPLVKEYFASLWNSEETTKIFARISTWYNSKGFIKDISSLDAAQGPFLALKHSLLANDVITALNIMFGENNSELKLYNWMVLNGHLWECSELLSEIINISEGETKGQCIIAKANLMYQLDLPQLTSVEIDEAMAIFKAKIHTKSPNVFLNLAKCFALKGIISAETKRSSDAIPFYDQAIMIFNKANKDKGDKIINDLVKTISNRGVAKFGIGDWESALDDYKHADGLLRNVVIDKPENVIHNGNELQVNIAAIKILDGKIDEAIKMLEPLVNDIRKKSHLLKNTTDKNNYFPFITLGAAYNKILQPFSAIKILTEIVEPVKSLEEKGQKHIRNILAQVLTNRAQSYLLCCMEKEALEDANYATQLYDDLIADGSDHFSGQFANALFLRAYANFINGNNDLCENDINKANLLSSNWIKDWFTETNISLVFLENALEAISYLPDSFKIQKAELLKNIITIVNNLDNVELRFGLFQKVLKVLHINRELIRRVALQLKIEFPIDNLNKHLTNNLLN